MWREIRSSMISDHLNGIMSPLFSVFLQGKSVCLSVRLSARPSVCLCAFVWNADMGTNVCVQHQPLTPTLIDLIDRFKYGCCNCSCLSWSKKDLCWFGWFCCCSCPKFQATGFTNLPNSIMSSLMDLSPKKDLFFVCIVVCVGVFVRN